MLKKFFKTNKTFKIAIIALLLACIVLLVFNLTKDSKPIVITSTTLNFKLRDVGKLVTQEGYFRNLQSINDSRELFGITMPFTEKKYIYSYDGTVTAGIDFSAIDLDVDSEAQIVTVYMPPSEIFEVSVDTDSFVVYHETNNTFNPLKLEDINNAQSALIEEVRQMALANGMLESADKNAQVLISGFIHGIEGYERYTIVFSNKKTESIEQPSIDNKKERGH